MAGTAGFSDKELLPPVHFYLLLCDGLTAGARQEAIAGSTETISVSKEVTPPSRRLSGGSLRPPRAGRPRDSRQDAGATLGHLPESLIAALVTCENQFLSY